jgi:hypothetical protein
VGYSALHARRLGDIYIPRIRYAQTSRSGVSALCGMSPDRANAPDRCAERPGRTAGSGRSSAVAGARRTADSTRRSSRGNTE